MPASLREELCASFCGDLTVREVPGGLAISAMFEASDGDRLSCLVEQRGTEWRISDDGSFLGNLVAYGVDIRVGGRAEFLARALRSANARVLDDTLQIAVDLTEEPAPRDILEFLTALARSQDIGFWTRERVQTTFREDATAALRQMLGTTANVIEEDVIDPTFEEFPCDLVVRPVSRADELAAATAVFLAQSLETLNDAMALAQEARVKGRRDIKVTAIIDEGLNVDGKRARRALNRIAGVSFFQANDPSSVRSVAEIAVPWLGQQYSPFSASNDPKLPH